jgi:hypothetical protein
MFEDEEDSRVGLIWSHDEDLYLLDNLKKNKDIEEIADLHKRNEGGIHLRIRAVALKLYNQRMNKKEISQRTKLDIDTINEIIGENKYEKSNYFNIKKEILNIEIIEDNKCEKSNNFDVKKEILNMKNEIVDIRLDMINIKTLIYEMKNDIFNLNKNLNY